MAKFNTSGARSRVHGPITGDETPSGQTALGAPGYARDLRSELFLLVTTNLVLEDTYHEGALHRHDRLVELVHQAALLDPDWTYELFIWLRGPGNLRTVALVGAVEFVRARLMVTHNTNPDYWNEQRKDANLPGLNRRIINEVCQRADEPGEVLAYFTSYYGRQVPKPIKRGLADAVKRLYNERSLLKYDTSSHAWRFGDAIDLTHPRAKDEATYFDGVERSSYDQGALYEHALDRRHNRTVDMVNLDKSGKLNTIVANHTLRWLVQYSNDGRGDTSVLLDPDTLRRAGMTWEDALSLAGNKVSKAKLWEAMIPSMNYMALLRNLRNFTQAEISDEVANTVMTKLMNPDEVKRSRQLPLRFLSAYRAAGADLRWAWPLEQALDHSLANTPRLHGNTLVLIDTSSSMNHPLSERSDLKRWDAATLFGIALARRCDQATVVSYSAGAWHNGDGTKVFATHRRGSLLTSLQRWQNEGYFIGWGTDTAGAIRKHLRPEHDRMVLLTDEQSQTHVESVIPADVRAHTINVAGYRYGHTPANTRNRFTYGGLTDNVFHVLANVEAGQDAHWPWEQNDD
jgi:hypothetical protein